MMATLRRDALLVLAFSLSVASAARAEGKASDKARQLVDFDPAPLPAVRLPATRPRVWFAATDLPELRKRCQTTHKAHLDRIRQGVEDGNRRPGSRAFDLAFLYQMTGDANHARQAIALAREAKPFAWVEKNAKSVPCGDFYAGMADPLACVFDWCNDQLTADDRATIGGVLRAQLADGPYRTQFHVPWWMAHWLSNILALFDAGIDDKLASDHLAAYNRSLHQFAALADEIHADSAMGDYHHQYNHLMLPAEMWLRATGENFFQKCAFYRNQPAYQLYTVLPDGQWLANDGDGPMDSLGSLGRSFMPNATIFHFYGWRNNNPYARWLARQMRGGWDQPWKAILWADEKQEVSPLSELPGVKFFPSNGCAIMRSGWDLNKASTDIVAAFYCRPFEAHTHYNAGDFMIWRGLDRLAGRGGFYWGTKSTFYHNFFIPTVAHNGLLIYDPDEDYPRYGDMTANDGGQLRGDMARHPLSNRLLAGSNPFFYRGEVRTLLDDPRFTYLFADLTPAYNAAKAVRVTRAFLWLKPATFVVCDRVVSVKPGSAKRWLLHAATPPKVDGTEKLVNGTAEAGILESLDSHLVTIRRGGSALRVQSLLPERAVIRRIGGEGYAYWTEGRSWAPEPGGEAQEEAIGAKRAWRIEVEPCEPSAEAVFLHVLDAGSAEAPPPPQATLITRAVAVGVGLARPGAPSEALFHPDGRASVDGAPVGEALSPLKPFGAVQ